MLKAKRLFIVSAMLCGVIIIGLVLYQGNSPQVKSVQAQDHTPVATEEPSNADAPPYFDGERALEFAAMQVDFGVRPVGSEALTKTGDAIIAALETAGWEVVTQEFPYDANGQIYPVRNIIAKRGNGPITMLASHYDTRMIADNDPDPLLQGDPVLGANDAASSAAVLLEMAEAINDHYEITENNQIWLVFFDAEDNGRIPGWDWIQGSRYMAAHLDEFGVMPEDFNLMILFDMVGEADTDREYIGFNMETEKVGQKFYYESNSFRNAPEQTAAIWQTANDLGFADQFAPETRYNLIDDHMPFVELGIPAVDIIDFDYPYWHTTSDTLDKLSATSLDRVGSVVEMYLLQTGVLQVKPE
ncbi:MAG: M28 family peptidase [Chloroflexi bacterium]|nr:M28 family peptidase [Chloroflexota bacterium]